MRHVHTYAATFAVFVGLLLSLVTIASRPQAAAYYKQTGQSACNPGILPANCGTNVTGTDCTSTSGGVTKVYYRDEDCTVKYYRQF